jgi:hypothetical protein
MTIYDGSPQADLLLLEWWTRMAATADLERAFSASHASVGTFFGSFRPPSILLYEADDQGIWFAAWFDPVMSGAFYGLWTAPHKRSTKVAFHAVQESIAFGLEKFPVLIGAMREAKVARQAVRFGARIPGVRPLRWATSAAGSCRSSASSAAVQGRPSAAAPPGAAGLRSSCGGLLRCAAFLGARPPSPRLRAAAEACPASPQHVNSPTGRGTAPRQALPAQ